MTRERIYLFDTTLRDGQQTPGVDFSLEDKLVVMGLLQGAASEGVAVLAVVKKAWAQFFDQRPVDFEVGQALAMALLLPVAMAARGFWKMFGPESRASAHAPRRLRTSCRSSCRTAGEYSRSPTSNRSTVRHGARTASTHVR